ncbi:MAG: AMP-binding protein [Oligoflexales bacterium]
MSGLIKTEGADWSWGQVESAARALGEELGTKASDADPYVVVQPSSPLTGCILVLASIKAGLIPLIDERRLYTGDYPVLHDIDFPITEFLRDRSGASDRQSTLEGTIGFFTSGSTALPKLILKSWTALLAEARTLGTLYELDKTSKIVSLISPFHIYGFLHGWVVPFSLGASLEQTKVGGDAFGCKEIDLLVTVPALWSPLENDLPSLKVRTMVTSGAEFGLQRLARFQNLPSRPERLIDILGSTETGAIGYRYLDLGDQEYTLMNTVELDKTDEGYTLRSDFIAPAASVKLSDKIVLTGDRRFLYQGRSDRVFKYSGKRFSLSEVERNLSSCLGSASVVAAFFADEKMVKGGCLKAWVVHPEQSLWELRRQYRDSFDTPFPDSLFFVSEFVPEKNGKVTISSLLRQTESAEQSI